MKILITILFISLCLTSFSLAQQDIQQNYEYKDDFKTMEKRVQSYVMVQYFIANALTLDLTNSQRQQLDNVKKDYLYPMIQKETDFRVSEMKVMDLLKNPDFEAEKVKSAIKNTINLTLENALMSIDALAAIRKAVGIDNFNTLLEMMNSSPRDSEKNKNPIENDRYTPDKEIQTL